VIPSPLLFLGALPTPKPRNESGEGIAALHKKKP
jgi:hypothetical protein